MPKYNVLAPEQRLVIKYKGMFDMQNLYALIRKWYDKRGFEFHENLYKSHEVKTGNLQVFMNGYRYDTPYMSVWIEVSLHGWDLSTVDVIQEGKKREMTKARIRVNLEARVETDYEHKWESSKFFSTLRDFYEKYILRRRIEQYIVKIEYEIHSLQENIKKALGMEAEGGEFGGPW